MTLKRAWADGTRHLLLSPTELIGRLAALVPPKGFNSVRYHGVLASRSSIRRAVLATVPRPTSPPAQQDDGGDPELEATPPTTARPGRLLWAQLLKRVFRVEVEMCPCGGRFRLVAFIQDPLEAQRYLAHEGLDAEPVYIAPARGPPQAELAFEGC